MTTPRKRAPRGVQPSTPRPRAGRSQPEEPSTPAAQIRSARARLGMTQRALARFVARDDDSSPDVWAVRIAQFESGAREPSPEQLDRILYRLNADPDARARAAVGAVLTSEVVGRLVRDHGADRIASAIAGYAAMLPLLASVDVARVNE